MTPVDARFKSTTILHACQALVQAYASGLALVEWPAALSQLPLHTICSYFSYALVPFGWLSPLSEMPRSFSIGSLLFPGCSSSCREVCTSSSLNALVTNPLTQLAARV